MVLSRRRYGTGPGRGPAAMQRRYVELLARRALDRKKSAEDRLLAVEVQIVRAGKALPDFLAQSGPARGWCTVAEAAQYRALFGLGGGLRDRPGSRHRHPREQPPEQFFDGPVALLRLGARKPVGEGMQRQGVNPGIAVQQAQHRAVKLDPARRGEIERSPDAAAGERRDRLSLSLGEFGAITDQQLSDQHRREW